MRKIIQQTALTALLLALVLPTSVYANDAELIWIKSELAPFKQLLVPARELTLHGRGPISVEEWEKFNSETLDVLKLNEPISTSNWATLMKLAVQMPEDAKQRALTLQAYVDDFNQQGFIHREDAVGGMVKLLSLRTMNASSHEGDPDPQLALKDVSDINAKQLGLFHIAYREGLLDSFVKDQFRPKDLVTHREAVSMAYRILQKFGAPFGYDAL